MLSTRVAEQSQSVTRLERPEQELSLILLTEFTMVSLGTQSAVFALEVVWEPPSP